MLNGLRIVVAFQGLQDLQEEIEMLINVTTVVTQDIGQEIVENLHQEIEKEEEIEGEDIVVAETGENAAALDLGIVEITEEVVVLDLRADPEAQDVIVIVKDLEAEVVPEAQRRARKVQVDLPREKRVVLRVRALREAGKSFVKYARYKVFSQLNC